MDMEKHCLGYVRGCRLTVPDLETSAVDRQLNPSPGENSQRRTLCCRALPLANACSTQRLVKCKRAYSHLITFYRLCSRTNWVIRFLNLKTLLGLHYSTMIPAHSRLIRTSRKRPLVDPTITSIRCHIACNEFSGPGRNQWKKRD